jgi:hypothetical protein
MIDCRNNIFDIWRDNSFRIIQFFLSFGVVAYLVIFNPFGMAPDYSPYISYFDIMRAKGFVNPFQYEPGFVLLSWILVVLMPTSGLVFGVLAGLASTLKLILFSKLASPFAYFLIFLLFLFKYFPLQDCNQIRIALALVFLIFTYYKVVVVEDLRMAIIFSLISIIFHYSTLAVFPFLLLLRHKFSENKYYAIGFAGLVFSGLALASYFAVHFLMGFIPRFSSYAGSFQPAVSNPLSPVFYPEFFLITVSLVLWEDLTTNMKKVVALQLVGFAIFYGLYDFGVIGTRLREVIAIFWLFYLVDFSKMTINLKRATVFFVLMNIALGSYLFYFSNYFK